jgi:hypothetical protein
LRGSWPKRINALRTTVCTQIHRAVAEHRRTLRWHALDFAIQVGYVSPVGLATVDTALGFMLLTTAGKFVVRLAVLMGLGLRPGTMAVETALDQTLTLSIAKSRLSRLLQSQNMWREGATKG